MVTDAGTPRSSRPRPVLLILLGVLVVGLVAMKFFGGSAATPAPASNPRRSSQAALTDAASAAARGAAASTQKPPIDPAILDVRLESLAAPRPVETGPARNPFRFRPAPPPPPPPMSA